MADNLDTPLCIVQGCRYPSVHVTKGHMCGSCRKYGHGRHECGKRDHMNTTNNDTTLLDDRDACTVPGCRYPRIHRVL